MHFHFSEGNPERELRLVAFAGGAPESFMDKLDNDKLTGSAKEYNLLSENREDIEALFNYFAANREYTIAELQSYIDDRKEAPPLQPFEQELDQTLQKYDESSSDADQRAAEASLNRLLRYMQMHQEAIDQVQTKFRSLREKISPSGASMDDLKISGDSLLEGGGDATLKTGANFAGDAWNAFKKAKGADKLYIAGGAVFALLLVAKTIGKLSGQKTGFFGGVGNLLGLGLGAYVTVKAVRALNKSSTLINGRPLYASAKGMPPVGETMKDWNKKKYDEQLNVITKELQASEIPANYINAAMNLTGKHDIRFSKGMVNLSVLPITDFLELYEQGRAQNGSIDDIEWPGHPCPDSKDFPELNLTPKERFQLVKEIAKSLGLLDADGNAHMPEDPNLEDQTVLYMMLDDDIDVDIYRERKIRASQIFEASLPRIADLLERAMKAEKNSKTPEDQEKFRVMGNALAEHSGTNIPDWLKKLRSPSADRDERLNMAETLLPIAENLELELKNDDADLKLWESDLSRHA